MDRVYFKTYFYSDPYIVRLSKEEKLFYLYLIQNPKMTSMGIYEFTPYLLTSESGFSVDEIDYYLNKFINDQKIQYVKGYVIINNFLKHQTFTDSIMINVLKNFLHLPIEVLQAVVKTKSIMDCFMPKIDKYKHLLTECHKRTKNKPQDTSYTTESFHSTSIEVTKPNDSNENFTADEVGNIMNTLKKANIPNLMILDLREKRDAEYIKNKLNEWKNDFNDDGSISWKDYLISQIKSDLENI